MGCCLQALAHRQQPWHLLSLLLAPSGGDQAQQVSKVCWQWRCRLGTTDGHVISRGISECWTYGVCVVRLRSLPATSALVGLPITLPGDDLAQQMPKVASGAVLRCPLQT